MKKGFTLIELLVVIAIIAILSSVVIVYLSSSQKSAKDARVVVSIKQFKNIMEVKIDGSGNFPRVANVRASGDALNLHRDICKQQGITASCGTMNLDSGSKRSGVSSNDTSSTGTNPVYCVYAHLPSNVASFTCVDSKGNFKAKSSATSPCAASTCQ